MLQGLGFLSQEKGGQWRDYKRQNTVDDQTASSHKVYKPVWSVLRVERVVPITGWS